MRMKISNGKTGPVSNANETSGSIYSFALWEQNIITCEFKRSTGAFAFYRVPKASGDAQLFFEHDSPALMDVYDNKIFMLFPESHKLGVFDPKTDARPVLIDIGAADEAVTYFPQFSVASGYLYYGVRHDGEESIEYFRRSLYTGETVSILVCEAGDAIWNPCWDNNGNAYYGHYNGKTATFGIAEYKDGESRLLPELSNFVNGSPLIAVTDKYLVASDMQDTLYMYGRDDFSIERDTTVSKAPYAVTRDFIVADDGIYRISDFSFIPFDK